MFAIIGEVLPSPGRRRQNTPRPIKTAVAPGISVAGSGITAVVEIEPFTAVNGIKLPLMSESEVPTFGLAIVAVG